MHVLCLRVRVREMFPLTVPLYFAFTCVTERLWPRFVCSVCPHRGHSPDWEHVWEQPLAVPDRTTFVLNQMLKARRNLETRLIVQQCAQQHITLQLCLRAEQKVTKLLKSRQRNQGYQKTWSAQRIRTISKHASRPLSQNMTVDCSYNS